MDYEVLQLKKACEEMALKNIILSSRLDDLEARFEHVRMLAFNACETAVKTARVVGDDLQSDAVAPAP